MRFWGTMLFGAACAACSIQAQAQTGFRPYQVVTPLAASSRAIHSADVNGDGRDDVIVATTQGSVEDSANDYRLHIFLQRGDGRLAAPIKITADIGGDFVSLATADMNKDGVQDILAVHKYGVSLALGSRTAAFSARQTWWGDSITHSYGGSLTTVDVNRDGYLDVLALSPSQGTKGIGVFLGDGKGGLVATSTPLATPGYIFDSGQLNSGDLNGDGNRDVVVTGTYSVYALLHDGATGYLAPKPYSDFYAAVVGDFNADGRDDLLTARNTTPNIVYVFSQDSTGALPYSGYFYLAHGMNGPVVMDMSGDGRSDLLTRDVYTGAIGYYRQGATGLALEGTYAIPSPAVAHTAGDINGDGRKDVVVLDATRGMLVLFGRSLGSDFNGDGRSDLFWRNAATGGNAIWYSATNTPVLPTVAAADWSIVAIEDFDGDGRDDVLWRNGRTGSNSIWKSANSATVQAVSSQAVAWIVAGTGDFNADGQADILWRNSLTGANVIWKSANATAQQPLTAVTNLQWFVAGTGDFDGDGRCDVLWRNRHSGANAIWKAGNYADQIAVTTVTNLAWQVAGTGDFDGDGRFDVLWRNGTSGANAIWKAGDYTQQLPVSALAAAWKLAHAGDVDRDGRSDLVWRNSQSGANVTWKSANASTTETLPSVVDQAWQIVR